MGIFQTFKSQLLKRQWVRKQNKIVKNDKGIIYASIIGVGKWGLQYIELLERSPLYKLISIYDNNEQYLNRCLAKYKVKCETFDEMLHNESIDTIFILLPNHLHYEYVKKAFLEHKNVFVEKPLTCDFASSQELYNLSKQNNVCLYVGHSMKMKSSFDKMKSIIDSNEIGNVHQLLCVRSTSGLQNLSSISWRANKTITPLLPMIQLGIHLIDVVNYLFNDMEVVSSTITQKNGLTESACCLMSNKKTIASIVTSYNTEDCFEITVFGDKGVVVLKKNLLLINKNGKSYVLLKKTEHENEIINELNDYYLWNKKGVFPKNSPDRALLNVYQFGIIEGFIETNP